MVAPRTEAIHEMYLDVEDIETRYEMMRSHARQIEGELNNERQRFLASRNAGYEAGLRLAADIADTYSSVEGIAQRIRDAILAEADK